MRGTIIKLGGVVLLLASLAGVVIFLTGRRPSLPAAPAIVTKESGAALRPTPAPPTETPKPIPTMLPVQLVIEGPERYPGAWPYLAQYTARLVRGGQATVTVSCVGCLWRDGEPILVVRRGAPAAFQALVLPGRTVSFAARSNDHPCTAWELAPGGNQEAFQTSCATP